METVVGCLKCSDESYVEDDLVCLLSTGETCVFAVPSLRRQTVVSVVGRDNVLSVLPLSLSLI